MYFVFHILTPSKSKESLADLLYHFHDVTQQLTTLIPYVGPWLTGPHMTWHDENLADEKFPAVLNVCADSVSKEGNGRWNWMYSLRTVVHWNPCRSAGCVKYEEWKGGASVAYPIHLRIVFVKCWGTSMPLTKSWWQGGQSHMPMSNNKMPFSISIFLALVLLQVLLSSMTWFLLTTLYLGFLRHTKSYIVLNTTKHTPSICNALPSKCSWHPVTSTPSPVKVFLSLLLAFVELCRMNSWMFPMESKFTLSKTGYRT